MRTAYIGKMPGDVDDFARTAAVEIRVDPSEAFDGKLAVGIYGWQTGHNYATGHLTRAQAVELRDALQVWLGEKQEV